MSVKITFAGTGDAFGSGGRFNACFIVEAPDLCFAIDFGATSLNALNAIGFAHNRIDAILISHLHSDHLAGVPSLLIDAMLGAKRTTPLTVAGTIGTRDQLEKAQAALFPGSHVMVPKFDYEIIEMEMQKPYEVRGLKIMTWPAIHTPQTNPTSMRIEVAGKTIAYTGDSEWTEHMPEVAKDADLFISECYFYEKAVSNHMNYPDLVAHRDEITAKHTILTHMGPQMLANLDKVDFECAHDGLVIDLG